MTPRIVRVGNSLLVEIPEELVAELGLQVGEPLEWVANGSGSISLVGPPRRSVPKKPADMTLEELLEGIPEGAEMERIDWGPDRGAEVW